MDYRKFLSKGEAQLLPYFGGTRLEARDRHLRLAEPLAAPGWYAFDIRGRYATMTAPAEAPSLADLTAVRGHLLGNRLVREGAQSEEVFFPPAEEPPRFAPATARRWPSGELLFDQLDFEGEAEESVRRALEDEGPLSEVKGVAATLRAAYGYALLASVAERLHVPMSFAEAKPHVLRAAQEGRAGAEAGLRALAAERVQAQREWEELVRRRRQVEAQQTQQAMREARRAAEHELERQLQQQRDERVRGHGPRAVVHERARLALEDAGSRVHAIRALGDGLLEATYSFMGERFVSIAHAGTLQVMDSGICLGHPPSDELLTLDSLPSVIKEAIDTDRLVKLRHA